MLAILGAVAVTLSLSAASPVGSADLVGCTAVGGELKQATVVGTAASDTLVGTPGQDVIAGLGGDDMIDGAGADDLICGGDGNDRLLGGDGIDELSGDAGDDTVDGGPQPPNNSDFAAYDSAPSPVTVNLTLGTATGWGSDVITGVEGASGSNFSDSLTGGATDDQLIGQKGNDTLDGAAGVDYLSGSEGDDVEIGGAGVDTAYYWNAPRSITASLATNRVSGWGRDRLVGIEDLDGSNYYADRLVGNGGANFLRGFGGNDTIIAGAGNDVLQGQKGNDKLDGGPGRDRGDGGPGRDTCRHIERKKRCETG